MYGLRTAKNWRPRILLNSILNQCGRNGSRIGNTAAVLGLLYSSSVWALDRVEFDKVAPMAGLTRRDIYTPMAAAAITAFAFRAPRMGSARGNAVAVVSGVMAGAAVGVAALIGPSVLGDHAPFRWA